MCCLCEGVFATLAAIRVKNRTVVYIVEKHSQIVINYVHTCKPIPLLKASTANDAINRLRLNPILISIMNQHVSKKTANQSVRMTVSATKFI